MLRILTERGVCPLEDRFGHRLDDDKMCSAGREWSDSVPLLRAPFFPNHPKDTGAAGGDPAALPGM